MIDCREASRLRERFLALELPPGVESELRAHLATCRNCRGALAMREPAVALAARLHEPGPVEDDGFVAAVLAGVHQHKLERRLTRRRGYLAAAAAVVIAIAGGWLGLRGGATLPPGPAPAMAVQAQASEPAFVEVEGEGVRLYQLTPAAQDAVQVAFIIDPRLEL
jgi:anti-sigma factor RsiW